MQIPVVYSPIDLLVIYWPWIMVLLIISWELWRRKKSKKATISS